MTRATRETRLLIRRDRLDDMQLETREIDTEAADGEVVLGIDLFALTTNNITYAVYGDALGYWRFFPVDATWGQLPVWGYAGVVDSAVEGIEPGQRWFGYFPLATHLRVRPGKAGRGSFRDETQHRRDLPEIYNWYQRTDNDPAHDAETEPLHAIYRPLFVTAFCLADYLREHDLFGARRMVVSSASSKTGYATVFCLGAPDDVEVVGLTSGKHRDFVERTGLYRQVAGYDQLDSLDPSVATLYVDIAGDAGLRRAVHRHFGDRLAGDVTVGSARSLEPAAPEPDLPGARPEFFFAPDWIARRHADWGVAGFDRRIAEATAAFYGRIGRSEAPLVKLVEHDGMAKAPAVVGDLLAGRVDPLRGHVVRCR